jgi:hypothetical protein
MLRDILLNHAWGLFNHSELTLLEESLKALPWESLLENPRLVLLQAWLMQSQHRYSEVNTLLARAEQEMESDMDTTLHGEFNALRAQVAINDGDPDEAERLAMVALDELPLANFYSRIVATSVHGEVLHCKGDLTRSLSLMQQTEQMARRHDVWHYALWSLIQQSEILFAQGFLQAAWKIRKKPSSSFAISIWNSCRCMSSCCVFAPSFCGRGRAWMRQKVLPVRVWMFSPASSRNSSCSVWHCWCSARWRAGIWITPATTLTAWKTCSVTVSTTATGYLTPIRYG